MEELIKLLRDTRKEKKITLQDIAEQTKVKIFRLEAFEKGDFSVFAGEVYLKGVIGSYAKAVGLNPAHVLEIYHRAQQMVEHPRTDEVEKVEKPKATGRKGKNRTLSIGLYTALALMFFIAIWISVGKNVEKAPGPIDHDPINNETIQQPEEDDQLPAGDKREEEAAEEEGKKIEIMLKNTSAYDSYWNFKGAEDPEIKIVFIGKCWIDLHVDNKNIHQKNFYAGEELLLSVKNKMKLRLGNPPAVKVFIDGIELEGLSDKKNPHNYHFTRTDD